MGPKVKIMTAKAIPAGQKRAAEARDESQRHRYCARITGPSHAGHMSDIGLVFFRHVVMMNYPTTGTTNGASR